MVFVFQSKSWLFIKTIVQNYKLIPFPILIMILLVNVIKIMYQKPKRLHKFIVPLQYLGVTPINNGKQIGKQQTKHTISTILLFTHLYGLMCRPSSRFLCNPIWSCLPVVSVLFSCGMCVCVCWFCTKFAQYYKNYYYYYYAKPLNFHLPRWTLYSH